MGNDATNISLSRNEKFASAMFLLWFFIPLLVALTGELFFDGTALTSNVHIGFYMSVAAFWALVLFVLWQFLPNLRKLKLIDVQKQRPFGMIALVAGYLIFILPYFSRRIVEIVAFTGLNAPATEAYLLIAYSTGRHSWNHALVGPILGQYGRTVSIKVNEDLKWRYNHVSTHDKDCIRVAVQSGRLGYERIVGPGIFDDGITESHIVRNCNAGISH